MFSMKGSEKCATGLPAAWVAAVMIMALPLASAETVMTINGKAMDSDVVDSFIKGRVQKPLDQVTAEERDFLVNELTDIYVLSTTEAAAKLEDDPDIAAQIELQRLGILARAVIAELMAEIVVSEEEIKAMYEEQIKLAPGQQYKASHILVETQAEALEIIEALLTGGNFAELAKERSTGPSGPKGGELDDWFMPDQMAKPFSDAVMKLADGRYTTDPVQTQFGWHVIRRDGARAAEPPPLEGVRETVKARLQGDKLRARIDELKAAAIKQ